MHYYGEWPDELFAQVDDAASYIGLFCRRWGRIQVSNFKEKYGTVRVYCHFGCDNLQDFFYPGYVYIQRPRWMKKLLGDKLTLKIMGINIFKPFKSVIFTWQKYIYRLAYKNALKKYPMIREEILCCVDFDEFLEGL